MLRKAAVGIAVACGFGAFFVAFFSPILFGGKYLTSGDGEVLALPAYLMAHSFWEPNIMLGYPWAANLNAFWYPLWLLRFIPGSFNAYMVLAYVIAASGMFGLVVRSTRSFAGALTAALAYSLGGFMISHLGHYDLAHPAAWAPWVLWSIVELRSRFSAGWVVGGSLAVALCATSGGPQVLAYVLFVAAFYVVTTAWGSSRGPRYALSAASAVVLGLGVCAVSLVPAAELAHASVRAKLSFGDFVSYSMPPVELPVHLLFPWFLGPTVSPVYPYSSINVSFFTEVADYAGIVTLIFAVVALVASGRDRDVRFWAAVAVAGLVLSTGDGFHVARLTYHVPLFNLFRAQGRNAVEVTLALAVLAGYGVAAVAQSRATRRHVTIALAVVGGCIAASLLAIWLVGGALAQRIVATSSYPVFPIDPLHNPALGIPVVLFVVAAVVIFGWTYRPSSRVLQAAVVAVAALDMFSFAWFSYWQWDPVDPASLNAPSYVAPLAANLARSHDRLLSVTPLSTLQPDVPLLWGLPDAGGYVQLLLARPGEFLQMYPNGEVRADLVVSPGDQALDLAAVRYVATLAPPAPVAIAAPWYGSDLRLALGGQPWGVRGDVTIPLPAPVAATGVSLQDGVVGTPADGQRIARLDAITADGRALPFDVVAGAPATFSFAQSERILRLALHWNDPTQAATTLLVSHISLLNAPLGVAYPVTLASVLQATPDRWRPVPVTGPDLIFENRHPIARAWLVHDVRAATEDESAVRTRAVDLRNVAFVEGSPIWEAAVPPSGAESAVVRTLAPTAMRVDVTCSGRCFLVTSDAYYEGWHATIDGTTPTPVYRTDYALRGVVVPGGRHQVTFTYRPWTLVAGGAISLLSLLVLGAIAVSTKVVEGGRARSRNGAGP